MFAIEEGLKKINGETVETFCREVVETNTGLLVEAGTTGYKGGCCRDTGGRTFIGIVCECGDFHFGPVKNDDGQIVGVEIIYTETMRWLKERGCDRLVNHRLVESYSEAFARYIQCSEAVSKFGLLGKHPTTNAPIASPFVQMALSFQKQANLLWYEIFDVVKQNSTTAYEGSPQDDAMEKLLRARSKHR